MNQTPSSICYLDPAVEEALYRPREAIAPIQPIDAMAEDMATEWVDREVRPTWLNCL